MIGEGHTGTNFGYLQSYLIHGRTNGEPGLQDYLLDAKGGAERVAWATTRNIFPEDPRYAAEVMSVTAEQNTRVKKPVYHLYVSAAPGEELTRQQWEGIVDRLLGDLGLGEHQALIVAHNDTRHQHVHVMINRVHAQHIKAWDNGWDNRRIERSLRHIERDMGLREVPGRHFQLEGQAPPGREGTVTSGERREAERTGEKTWADRTRFKIYEDLRRAESWGDIERRLARHGLRLERRGGGLVITDGEHRVKASRIYRRASYHWLEKRFGMSFEEWRTGRRELVDAVARYRDLERRRDELGRAAERAWRAYVSAREQAEERGRIRDASRRASGEIHDLLRRLYRPEDVRGARRLLVADARRHGWEEAGRRVDEEPGRYGRPRNRWHDGRPRFGRRRFRDVIRWRLKSAAKDMAVLRAARLVAGPEGFRAAAAVLLAKRTWQRAQRRRNGLPPSKTVLKEIAGRALALGVSSVSLALAPEPLKLVRTALRAAQLVQVLVRDNSR